MVTKDEILKELKVGEVYTSRQMRIFTTYNDVLVLCDEVSEFTDDKSVTFEVVDAFTSYLHQYKYPDTYKIPDRRRKVYRVSKVDDNLW